MTLTFAKLIDLYNITIPIIQRDYAQGRESEGFVRTNFLDKLHETLVNPDEKDGISNIHLDFVYGHTNSAKNFIPLDGQQRLTTLFLLHWYIASKEGIINDNPEDEQSEHWKKQLSKFTYETRLSSKRFCSALSKKPIVAEVDYNLDELIINESWFLSSWNLDPTVRSMLQMLRNIDEYFYDSTVIWSKLIHTEIITFEFIDIKSEEFKLTDELYIKMNARGKPLSDFETFKAQFMDLLSGEEFKGKHLLYNQKEITYRQYFEFKIDGVWLNLFWVYRDKVDIDEAIINFLNTIAELLYYTDNHNDKRFDFEEALKTVFSKPKNAKFLFDTLDLLCNSGDLNSYFDQVFSRVIDTEERRVKLFDELETNLFLRSIGFGRLDIRQRMIFYALLYFKINHLESDVQQTRDFIRIFRNLLLRIRQVNNRNRLEYVSNLRMPDFSDYYQFIHEFTEEISSSLTGDIYEILINKKWSGFGENYLVPEQNKAKDILKSMQAKKAIHLLEDQNILMGMTDLLPTNSENISQIARRFHELFSHPVDESLIIRALLVHGDYAVQTHNWSTLGPIYFYGERAYWNRIFTTVSEDEETNNENKRIFSAFLNDFEQRIGNTEERLNAIILKYPRTEFDYRYYFIHYSAITDNEYNRTINAFTWYDENFFEINRIGSASGQPLSAYHLNPFLIALETDISEVVPIDLYGGRFTDELSVAEISEKIQISSLQVGWKILEISDYKIPNEIVEKYRLKSYLGGYLLKEHENLDRIQTATTFLKELP